VVISVALKVMAKSHHRMMIGTGFDDRKRAPLRAGECSQQFDTPNDPRQSASAVVLGKLMSVEGIARVTLRQTGEQAAGLGLVLVAER
jgi:hypothetical protein